MNSSTSSFKRWLIVFFTLLLGVSIPFVGAFEWLLRTQILPVDGFEQIVRKVQDSTIPNVAFGDSHAAAVSDFDAKDFLNLGLGGSTIRQMSDRAHFYFSRVKPGDVIVEADSHLFAEYRLVAAGNYVPESYSSYRLASFDERHRKFMLAYWERYFSEGLKAKAPETNRPDQLWKITNGLTTGAVTKPTSQAGAATPSAAATDRRVPGPVQTQPSQPAATQDKVSKSSAAVEVAAAPAAEVKASGATADRPAAPQNAAAPEKPAPGLVQAQAQASQPPATEDNRPKSSPPGDAAAAPASESKAPGTAADRPAAPQDEAAKVNAEFKAFMDYQVGTQTPVSNFRERDEARIYVEMIDFLIRRGARVCLMTYPVDSFYRKLADKLPTFAEVREFYKDFAKQRGIRYVSFWSRFDDPKMFQNTDHVNAIGSAVLAPEARRACFSD